jgi:hypothetical protein
MILKILKILNTTIIIIIIHKLKFNNNFIKLIKFIN